MHNDIYSHIYLFAEDADIFPGRLSIYGIGEFRCMKGTVAKTKIPSSITLRSRPLFSQATFDLSFLPLKLFFQYQETYFE